MLYHVSAVRGLTTLLPHTSTHGTPYVYAIENRVTALLFGAKQDDFDFIISAGENGTPVVSECRPGVFEDVYQNHSCSVYEVREDGFMRGRTGWEPELVCETPVTVLRETVVPDLWEELSAAAHNGALTLHRYAYTDAYRRMVAAHLADRFLRFGINPASIGQTDARFATHYKQLTLAMQTVLDGRLLA